MSRCRTSVWTGRNDNPPATRQPSHSTLRLSSFGIFASNFQISGSRAGFEPGDFLVMSQASLHYSIPAINLFSKAGRSVGDDNCDRPEKEEITHRPRSNFVFRNTNLILGKTVFKEGRRLPHRRPSIAPFQTVHGGLEEARGKVR